FKGSRGASSGAATAVKTISMPTRPPSAESVLRREKRAIPMARAFMGGSAVPDARVEPRVAQVDQHVDADEDHRAGQTAGLAHEEVPLHTGGNDRRPEAGPADRRPDGHRAA